MESKNRRNSNISHVQRIQQIRQRSSYWEPSNNTNRYKESNSRGKCGAYLQENIAARENGERVLLKLTGDFVDIICEVNPEHRGNIMNEKGRKCLYIKVLKAIYGCI